MRGGGVSPEGSGDRVSLLLSDESDVGTLVTTVEGWCAGREGLQTAERGGLGTLQSAPDAAFHSKGFKDSSR